jgi:hypothetical protein
MRRACFFSLEQGRLEVSLGVLGCVARQMLCVNYWLPMVTAIFIVHTGFFYFLISPSPENCPEFFSPLIELRIFTFQIW